MKIDDEVPGLCCCRWKEQPLCNSGLRYTGDSLLDKGVSTCVFTLWVRIDDTFGELVTQSVQG